MKKNPIFLKLILLIFTTTLVISCNNDDDNVNPVGPQPTGNEIVYDLTSVSNPAISGTATVIEINDNSITVELDLNNTAAGGSHPAHIHINTAVEGGEIAITLGTVDGATGLSTINFSTRDDGTPITYQQLLNFDGYINVHQSAADLETIIAQGDIGQNELSGESKVYELLTKDVPGISGTATLEERLNGTTLVTLMLEGTTAAAIHPAHIHENDAATGGDIVRTFNPVDGTTGISKTQVGNLDDATPITYTDLLTFDGYINVHLSAAQLNVLVAQGDIGSNEGPPPVINYDITNNGEIAYIFNGNALVNVSNPAITLTRGRTYTFTVNAPGHPFYIKTIQGIGTVNPYNTGVTNNGAFNGTVTFTVPQDAPDLLYYNCEFHAVMTNTITVID